MGRDISQKIAEQVYWNGLNGGDIVSYCITISNYRDPGEQTNEIICKMVEINHKYKTGIISKATFAKVSDHGSTSATDGTYTDNKDTDNKSLDMADRY